MEDLRVYKIMAYDLFDTNPPTEPMLTYCLLNTEGEASLKFK